VEVEIPHSEEEEEGELEADLSEVTRDRMENLIRLDRTTVEQVMTPRSSLVILPATATVAEAARAFIASGRSRIPLYGESRDDIVGILYFKDLISELVEGRDPAAALARGLARPSFWVPETKNAAELLDELRQKRVQIAIILDEFGALAGAVTIEDLIEVIIGPIDDEHDIPTPDDEIVRLADDTYQVDGATALEDLNDRLDLKLPTDEDYQTVGGLAFNALGRLPRQGDTFTAHGIAFTVLEVCDHSIRLIRLDLRPDPGAQAPAG
jgi:CBS domain containing-hemolysin-like protein